MLYCSRTESSKMGGQWQLRGKDDTTGHSFLAYFKRATSPLAVLRLLCERPMYGYELTQEMNRRSGGEYTLSLLYPVLYRLEEQKHVVITKTEVVDGRARSYYAATASGRAYLAQSWEEYRQISCAFCALMEGDDFNG